MATFYVLPSRLVLGQRFGDLLTALFPGIQYTQWDWPELAESLANLVEGDKSSYIVYREDLDEQLGVKDALMRDFGAALDDAIVEIQFGKGLHQFLHERWSTESTREAA
jgi:hypothetical protein